MTRTIVTNLSNMLAALSAATVFLWAAGAAAQGPPHAWSYGFGNTVADRGYGVATDAYGNTLVTGYFVNTVDFGGGNLVGAGSGDIFLAKYNATGAHVWSQRFGGTGDDEGHAVAVDGSGNVLVTGVFANTVDFGGGPLVSGGSRDIFVAKYDANGVHQWSRGFGSTSNDYGYALAVDASGNALVTGFFIGTVDFGGGNLVDAGIGDVFLAKYDAAGAHVWSQRFGGTSADVGRGVATDGTGNVFLTGSSEGTADFGGGALLGLGGNDIFLAKYNASGAHQWSQRFGNIQDQFGYDVAADGSGNVVMAGSFIGSVDFGGGSLPSVFNHDVVLAKYDPAGTHLWSQRFGAQSSSAGTAVPYALALDAADSVVVTGFFTQTIDFGGGSLTSGGAFHDIFLAKYAPDGAHLWSTKFGTTNSMDDGRGVAFHPWGHVVLTGHFSSAVDFGGGIMLTQGGDDIYVAKFGAGPASGVGDSPTHTSLRVFAYPNPFNPETTIRYTIPQSGQVTVAVHDARGARVALLVDAGKRAGAYSVRWNGRDGRGIPVASGVYFASVTVSGRTQSRKIVLTK